MFWHGVDDFLKLFARLTVVEIKEKVLIPTSQILPLVDNGSSRAKSQAHDSQEVSVLDVEWKFGTRIWKISKLFNKESISNFDLS